MVRIAVLDDYQGIALSHGGWERLPADCQVEAFRDHLSDEGALAQRLAPFEAVVAMRERTPFRRSLLERLPNLKLLITTGMRNASFDMAAAKDRGVLVCGTGGQPTPTAELSWGLIIGCVRHIAEEDKATRAGHWQTTIGPTLHGATLGCLGLGNLGSQVAKVGLAFGMNVIAWSQNLTAERAAEVGARLVSKDELFAQADVLSVHLVLSDRTRGLVGARELSLMKPTAFLINTSRGPIVDEAALIETLREKRIAGAGLDVFDEEPLPQDHPFLKLDNTLITPHLGYVTLQTYDRFYGEAVEDILGWLSGAPVRVIEN
ncbi:MAG TPA: D-2-hydroxyacid dehydrogenase family protein [Dehalococcoidia bacterium]|jgi:phosphoglycerate dehydrogenase-like enzyme|nr:D-2-hydroxyacid dehydrogenase family protein [Dehalococcoidia bacterium]